MTAYASHISIAHVSPDISRFEPCSIRTVLGRCTIDGRLDVDLAGEVLLVVNDDSDGRDTYVLLLYFKVKIDRYYSRVRYV